MLSKCLNPRCSATFRYLRQGRLFRIDFTEESRKSTLNGQRAIASGSGKAGPVEHFWLCESCAATMTIELSQDGEVRAVPFGISAEIPSRIPTRKPVSAATPPMHKMVANAS